eukprot:478852-Rhodomonas_salina.1
MPTPWDIVIKPSLLHLYQGNYQAIIYQIPLVVALSLFPWAMDQLKMYQRQRGIALGLRNMEEVARFERQAIELMLN